MEENVMDQQMAGQSWNPSGVRRGNKNVLYCKTTLKRASDLYTESTFY